MSKLFYFERSMRAVRRGSMVDIAARATQVLSAIFEAEMVFVALAVDRPVTRVKVLAAATNGLRAPTFVFDLKDTPCLQVHEGESLFIPCDLDKLYRAETPFAWQGYAGVPLRDAKSNEIIGHIALVAFKPLPNKAECMEVLNAAARALEAAALSSIGGIVSTPSARIARVSADIDAATGLFTSQYFDRRGRAIMENCKGSGTALACGAVQILSPAGEQPVDDRARVALGNVLRAHIGPQVGVGVRYGDDEFGFAVPGVDASQLEHLVGTIHGAFGHAVGVHFSDRSRASIPKLVGGTSIMSAADINFGVLYRRAQVQLYHNRCDQVSG